MGQEYDLSTWTYFGLVTDDGIKCVLETEGWESLDTSDQRIRGITEHTDQEIADVAMAIIEGFGAYDAMRNNCQDFAITLFLSVAFMVHDTQQLLRKAPRQEMEPFAVKLSWVDRRRHNAADSIG